MLLFAPTIVLAFVAPLPLTVPHLRSRVAAVSASEAIDESTLPQAIDDDSALSPPMQKPPSAAADALIREMETLRATAEAKTAEVEALATELRQTRAAVVDLELDYALEARALKAEESRTVQLEEMRTLQDGVQRGLEAALSSSEKLLDGEKARVRELKAETGSLSTQLESTLAELATSEDRAEALGAEKASLAATLETKLDELEAALGREATLSEQLANATAKIEELQAEGAELTAKLNEATERGTELNEQLADTQQRLWASEAQAADLEARLDASEAQAARLDVDLRRTTEQVASLQADKAALSSSLANAAVREAGLNADLKNTTATLLTTKEEQAAFEAKPALSLLAFGVARDVGALVAALRKELAAPTTQLGRLGARCVRFCQRVLLAMAPYWQACAARVRACAAAVASSPLGRQLEARLPVRWRRDEGPPPAPA